MKPTDKPPKVIDEAIAEVRSIKRAISERHGNDIDRLLSSLLAQERKAGIGLAEQGACPQPSVAEAPSGE